jgi:recombination protein RecA
MAKKKINKEEKSTITTDFTSQLIKSLNKEHGARVAYNLALDESPTHVKRWIATGSKQLDYIIAGRPDGGLPEGRIIEIFGPPSIGKSHIAIQIAKSTQQEGGIVVYIDTENATSVENLGLLGVDITKRFVYVDTHCTEEVLSIAEKTILRAKELDKDVPITIIWDSVAATSPKDELLGDYDKQTIGLNARVISRGMRKITGLIANEKVLLICLNQIRTKVGVMYGDPTTTPGGKAIPFHASVRIKLGAGQQLKDKTGQIYGINVWAKTIKNKVAPPFRKVEFEIHFGKGIVEHEQTFDLLRKYCKDNGPVMFDKDLSVSIEGTGAWKSISLVKNATGEVMEEKKFYKAEFKEIIDSPQWNPYVMTVFNATYSEIMGKPLENADLDPEAYEEMRQVAIDLEGNASAFKDL